MTRALVCGEGSHDIGTSNKPSNGQHAREEEGWLQSILRKLVDSEIEVVPVRRKRVVLQRRDQKRFRPLPDGHGAKALMCKLMARSGRYDLVVFMADADSRKRADWCRIRDEISDGFTRVQGVEGVPCVPMSTSESWLLADQDAWRRMGLGKLAILPKRPESIWGARNEPRSNHPHQLFRRVCIEAKVPDSRETRVQLADFASVEALRSRCPISFAAFVEDTQTAMA